MSKPVETEKLQKILARVGLGSRRELERWIEEGRVSVNGKIAKLGDRASLSDQIRVDGHLQQISKDHADGLPTVLMYHKPEGEICTRHDPQNRPTVFDHLPRLHQKRWVMVGRLDINSSGLLLFTDSGELANKLMHPSSEIEREYAVRVLGGLDESMIKELLEGVRLEDGLAKFDSIVPGDGLGVNRWYYVTLKEGRNREIRRMFEVFEKQVSRLVRIRFGDVLLPKSLRKGEREELDDVTVRQLMALTALKSAKP